MSAIGDIYAVSTEVADALRNGHPVVALETAVTTCGLPRQPLGRRAGAIGDTPWNPEAPINAETARAMQHAVRAAGAIPAIVVVEAGRLRIGLDDADLVQIAADETATKTSVGDLALALGRGVTAGTTVSATLHACTHVPGGPIRVFATGGIGGVHREWARHPDISADLGTLARSPVCTVCAGAKSILDRGATLEVLESLGVPVIGAGTACFPSFFSCGDSTLPITRMDDPPAIAEVCRRHWLDLGLRTALLVTQDPPAEVAIEPSEIDRLTCLAEHAARETNTKGPARTPFVLQRLVEATGGRSLDVNIALLVANARLAARIAVALA